MAKSIIRHPPPLRELARRLARQRDDRQSPLFPLGLNPDDRRPAVTAWDYRTDAGEARTVAGLD